MVLDTPGVGAEVDVEEADEQRATRIGLAGLVWAYVPVVFIARGSFEYLFEGQALRSIDLDRSPPPDESLDPPVLDASTIRGADEPDEIYEYP